jgi:hypothetical protein
MALYEDLGPDLRRPPTEPIEDHFPEDDDDQEPALSEEDSEFRPDRPQTISKLSGMTLRPYHGVGYRIIESVTSTVRN